MPRVCMYVDFRAAWTCAAPTGLTAGVTTTCKGDGALGTTCVFACEHGYTFSGDAESTCTADSGATTASYDSEAAKWYRKAAEQGAVYPQSVLQAHVPACKGI